MIAETEDANVVIAAAVAVGRADFLGGEGGPGVSARGAVLADGPLDRLGSVEVTLPAECVGETAVVGSARVPPSESDGAQPASSRRTTSGSPVLEAVPLTATSGPRPPTAYFGYYNASRAGCPRGGT